MNLINSAEKWVQNIGSQPGAQIRLFCFAYAGGSASVFRSWANELAPAIEVCPVQLPGRENRYREPAITDFAQLLETLKQVLQPYLNLPFAFFGHSLGGLIAFEMSRRVEQNPLLAARLQRLIVSGVRAPQFGNAEVNTWRLPRPEFVERLRAMGGTPEEILAHDELLDLLLPIVRADFQLLASYDYQAGRALSCPLTVFGGQADHKVTLEQLAGWQVQANQEISLKIFAGNHFFINSAKPAVLQELRQLLSEPTALALR